MTQKKENVRMSWDHYKISRGKIQISWELTN